MPRTHRISYPRLDDEGDVILNEFVQEVVPFTAEEELARDAEEELAAEKHARRAVIDERTGILQAKLSDDTITDAEIRELMRIEHGF